VMPRNTRTRPARVSTTKMSPLGATRMTRGSVNPVAKRFTLNPEGACGTTPSGLETIRDFVVTDFVANGFGRLSTITFRNKPGFTVVDETNADWPVRML